MCATSAGPMPRHYHCATIHRIAKAPPQQSRMEFGLQVVTGGEFRRGTYSDVWGPRQCSDRHTRNEGDRAVGVTATEEADK